MGRNLHWSITARQDAHDMYGVADHIGGAALAFRALEHGA